MHVTQFLGDTQSYNRVQKCCDELFDASLRKKPRPDINTLDVISLSEMCRRYRDQEKYKCYPQICIVTHIFRYLKIYEM